jgi:hypothetical protein
MIARTAARYNRLGQGPSAAYYPQGIDRCHQSTAEPSVRERRRQSQRERRARP